MGGWAVALRGIRYRPGRSLMVLLLATIAIAAAVLAPAYSRAAQQSVLTDRLAQAPADATGLQLRSDPVGGTPAVWDSTADADLMARQLLAHHPTLAGRLERPVAGSDVDSVLSPGADQVLARLTYRDDVCDHLTFTTGRCATQAGTVMLSARSAAEDHIGVGQKITPRGRTATSRNSTNQQTRTKGTATTGTVRPSEDASTPMSSSTEPSEVTISSWPVWTSVVSPCRSSCRPRTSSSRTAEVRSR